MRLRKMEGKESFSIKDLFDILVDSLKDYIPTGVNLNSILEDWEYTVESGDNQSSEDIDLTIPVTLDSEIDFLISSKVGCTVRSNFKVPYARVHLYDVKDESYEILVTLPSIGSLLDYFCGAEKEIYEEYPFEEWVSDITQANRLSNKLKLYLDQYTDDLNIVLNSLKEIDSKAFSIWKIINKK